MKGVLWVLQQIWIWSCSLEKSILNLYTFCKKPYSEHQLIPLFGIIYTSSQPNSDKPSFGWTTIFSGDAIALECQSKFLGLSKCHISCCLSAANRFAIVMQLESRNHDLFLTGITQRHLEMSKRTEDWISYRTNTEKKRLALNDLKGQLFISWQAGPLTSTFSESWGICK